MYSNWKNLTPRKAGLQRLELALRQSHEALLGQIAEVHKRLDRLVAKIDASAPVDLAPTNNALARVEVQTHQSHEVLLGQVGELGKRLDRMEAALGAAPVDLAPTNDSLARVELQTRQSHEVLLGQVGELGKRLDRMETALGAEPVDLAPTNDSLARVEVQTRQSHEVLLGQVGELGKRLDRIEMVIADEREARRRYFEAIIEAIQGATSYVDPDDRLVLNWRSMLEAQGPEIVAVSDAITREVLVLNAASNLTPLARKSPALRGFDWTNYLELSRIRVVRTAACLARRGARGRVLDMGSYFGNFALVLARLGYEVTALDSYAAYAPAFDRHIAAMRAAGVVVADIADVGSDLKGFEPGTFDAVLCMGVIEHVPHTPRLLLAAVDRVLKARGLLVMDTPNLAYEYQRQRLLTGQSIFAPIETQFETDIPFEGHHREYTPAEIRWIINRIGYEEIELEMYDYSIYGFSELRGRDLARWRAMEADPERRELIFVSARKPE